MKRKEKDRQIQNDQPVVPDLEKIEHNRGEKGCCAYKIAQPSFLARSECEQSDGRLLAAVRPGNFLLDLLSSVICAPEKYLSEDQAAPENARNSN